MKALSHRFVEEIPPRLEEGVLYVSMEYATFAHLCACGCGSETVTPLGRTEWRLTYDGEAVSLHPSVGNWSLPCRSHYIVRDGLVHWADSWTREEVEAGREADRRLKAETFAIEESAPEEPVLAPPTSRSSTAKHGLWAKIAAWFRGWRSWTVGSRLTRCCARRPQWWSGGRGLRSR